MNNSSNDGAFVILIAIITIGISIGSGILAWNWIEPSSFLGGIGFIIAWGIFSKIGHLLAMGIATALFDN